LANFITNVQAGSVGRLIVEGEGRQEILHKFEMNWDVNFEIVSFNQEIILWLIPLNRKIYYCKLLKFNKKF